MARSSAARKSAIVRTVRPSPLLCLALGLLILVACQAEAPEPTTGPASTAAVQEPTVERPQAESIPTAAATSTGQASAARETTIAGDAAESETAAADEIPIEETGTANADVEFVRATLEADGTWRFDVTVRHPDTGWDDYADGWDVVTPDGLVLKASEDDLFTRLLVHPHENEQPFTRSQSGIVVPDSVTVVVVRAHDLVDGFGGREVEVDLTVDQGPAFEVNRQ